uniref:BTB domain-containing protein n=1 Tax=Panagrolaimus davidi TaxID=227884 RepID=A0A914PMP7_9BILA
MISDIWNKKETIEITTNSYNDFYEFLTFLYSGNCKLNDENIFTMIDLSEFYQAKELQRKCDEYLSENEYTKENILVFFETLSKYSLPLFEKVISKAMKKNGINLVESDGFLETSKCIVEKIVRLEDRFVSEEKLFEKPLVKRGFLFSYDELSDILDNAKPAPKIKITNENGKSVICMLPNNSDIVEIIKSLKNRPCDFSRAQYAYWRETQIEVPSIPSQIKRRNDVEWYLYCPYGGIGVIQYSSISSHYLLAEMTPGTSGFEITQNCKIEIE